MGSRLNNNRGQTSLEYLLLMGATFISAYIVVTGPLANFTKSTIANVKDVMQNIVRNGELSSGGKEPGQRGHPSDRTRLKPLHL